MVLNVSALHTVSCPLTNFRKFLHDRNRDSVNAGIPRTNGINIFEFLPMSIKFLTNPFFASGSQSEKLYVFCKVSQNICITTKTSIGDYLYSRVIKPTKTLEYVCNTDYVRNIARLLGKRNGLTTFKRMNGQQLDGIEPIIIFVETLTCKLQVFRIC